MPSRVRGTCEAAIPGVTEDPDREGQTAGGKTRIERPEAGLGRGVL